MPSPPPLVATVMTTAVEKLQEQLIAWEEELTGREEALITWEKGAEISEKALFKVSMDLDEEWVKTEATRQEYLDKMRADCLCQVHPRPRQDTGGEEGPAQ
jgi:hypothetical protein